MSKLNIDQKSIRDLFSDKKSDFLIPDYQRPYAWGDKECQTLWEDIFTFAFPDDDYTKFNSDNDEYFLGPIVTFKNENGKQEIIDGQQRLTTLMLLLRAFYAKFANMMDRNSVNTRETIEKCIWKTDEFGNPNKDALKIDSEVATDNDKDEFLNILKTGLADGKKSAYGANYRFFENKISEFLNKYPSFFPYLPTRILNNCILLPIEAESQDTALRIFSTLNDRGKPLSDADIFKAQFYKFFKSKDKKDEFIAKWKELEELCDEIFHPISGTPMDELFTRYMYYERAKMGLKSSTTEALRRFYERDTYALLKKEDTFSNLIDLADFWNDVDNQNSERFSTEVLRRLYVLNYAPNGMWTYFVSVYYMANRKTDNTLDDKEFTAFLNKITSFIWGYAIVHPGVNALRTPVFAEMVNLVNNRSVEFSEFKFDKAQTKIAINNYVFSNNRAITKAMLTWWAFTFEDQSILPLETVIETEHIFARNRQDKEHSLTNIRNLESLGNKAILEKRINIRASDYRFEDKKKYYQGFTMTNGKGKEGTTNVELNKLATTALDFVETDIIARHDRIVDTFMNYLEESGLVK